MDPITRLCRCCIDENNDGISSILSKIGIDLTLHERELPGKKRMTVILKKWMDLAQGIIDMVVTKLPSPLKAQKYRAAALYQGPIDDSCGQAI